MVVAAAAACPPGGGPPLSAPPGAATLQVASKGAAAFDGETVLSAPNSAPAVVSPPDTWDMMHDGRGKGELKDIKGLTKG